MGMFLGWAIIDGHLGEYLRVSHSESVSLFLRRELTGTEIVQKCCDERLTNEDFDDVGNAFAKFYYVTDIYLDDYANALGDNVDSLFEVRDTWENFDVLLPTIRKRFVDWQRRSDKDDR